MRLSGNCARCAMLLVACLPFLGTPLRAADIPATVAGSAADADESGAGDNHNALPGAVPGLASPGVNGSGGVGSNGTLRFHIEWPLAGLPTSVFSAQVRLTTSQGGIGSLDTFFFAASGDGNGTLEDTDFETAATQVASVVMPDSNAGTFSFDATTQVNAALAAGFDYFVLQGRVDESLAAGTTFARGIQVRTTATSNDPSEFPQLIIQEVNFLQAPALQPGGAAVLVLALLAGAFWALRRSRAASR